jgi:hypothetical protein
VNQVALTGDLEAVLGALPTAPGVGQLFGADGRSLLLGRAANLRRWAGKSLGGGKPARKTGRPALDLRGIAVSATWEPTTSEFHQWLVFERRMAGLVPVAKRRDLKPAAWLHLDPSERFPRLSLRGLDRGLDGLFGPFRDRRAAERGRDALNKALGLRPCDFLFEPDPELPLGKGCLFAQVRSCTAPCLVRIGEDEYRSRARSAVDVLGGASAAFDTAWRADWISALGSSRGLVIEKGRGGIELYPVVAGAVLEEARAVAAALDDLAGALAGLAFDAPAQPRDDSAWLSAWLHRPRRKGTYLPCPPGEKSGDLATRVRGKLSPS